MAKKEPKAKATEEPAVEEEGKGKKEKKEKKGKKEKKKKSKFKKFLFFVIFWGGVGTGIYLNWDIINPIVAPRVENIPYLNKIFVIPVDETVDPYTLIPHEKLVEQLKAAEAQILTKEEEITALNQVEMDLRNRITGLQEYESNYEAFLEEKLMWSAEIAMENPSLFIEQYESMYPEDASRIYEALKGEAVLSKEQQEHAEIVAEMEEGQAAAMLELLLQADINLVKVIMENMDLDKQSAILSAMTTENAAQIVRLISPEFVLP
ncbi:hypothetical protein AN639_08990 [Candidatus Epulonipiscium fishelsonii]|uniref:Uncharacterized protein n=1 Tax=Candidatus Epulonipiscium fishelsonii TaxID=77094 RepID=A0ACC8XDH4_9FIRM|nr:hypothetical protein AN639_08990 [Epulopiscium sp. SCG-B05WGA-EpuloA1]ONI40981.1 hypothetical protein AN396_04275 [Epulopiscium sp. SCG-B11WGA-EpuloA1]ONI47333.1 hypothetical protein AN644_00720 [Epulopiscium sp. SCG-C06WGA-EpuloA1]